MNRENLINLATKSINVTADAINSVVEFTQEKFNEAKQKATAKEVDFSNATQIQKEFLAMVAENLQDIDDVTIIQCRDIITHQLDLKRAIIKINDDQITVENIVTEEVTK